MSKSHDESFDQVHLEDLTMLGIDFVSPDKADDAIVIKEVDPTEDSRLPKASLVIVAETDTIRGHRRGGSGKLLGSLSEIDFEFSQVKIRNWDRKTFYSDYIAKGLKYQEKKTDNVIMLFESEGAKENKFKFRFLNWPPEQPNPEQQVHSIAKGTLGPIRYAMMNGDALPCFYRHESPHDGLLKHWKDVLPESVPPHFVSNVDEDDCVYAYLPVEKMTHHVNDPAVHYHLAGKDTIHLMTQKTTRLLPDTKTVRPCVVKTTHSMGSKGIFIISNDEDELEFEQFLQEAGQPTFVVTDFVDIDRNVACHFFIHPNGENVTWFGSNENKRNPDGSFSSDSYLVMSEQENLKQMQLPFVDEVVQYCKTLGFWGFCGIDVLFDSHGRGHLVDINPRVTGSCPALMTLQILNKKYGFECGLFRRSGDITFYGSAADLWRQVEAYNYGLHGKSCVVIHSMYEAADGTYCRLNIGVYGNNMDACKDALNHFAEKDKSK